MEEEDEHSDKVNPIERKLEIMSNLTKRVKMMKVLIEHTFQDMRNDYSESNLNNFAEYHKKFETLKFLAKNLVTSKKEEKESQDED